MDYRDLQTVVTPKIFLYPVSNIMEITDCIHSATDTHPAIMDLVKSGLIGAYVNSCSQPSLLKGQATPLPGSLQGISAPLTLHTFSLGRI